MQLVVYVGIGREHVYRLIPDCELERLRADFDLHMTSEANLAQSEEEPGVDVDIHDRPCEDIGYQYENAHVTWSGPILLPQTEVSDLHVLAQA